MPSLLAISRVVCVVSNTCRKTLSTVFKTFVHVSMRNVHVLQQFQLENRDVNPAPGDIIHLRFYIWEDQ